MSGYELTDKGGTGLLIRSVRFPFCFRRRIMDKVGCNSMAELTRYAIREGYLDLS